MIINKYFHLLQGIYVYKNDFMRGSFIWIVHSQVVFSMWVGLNTSGYSQSTTCNQFWGYYAVKG